MGIALKVTNKTNGLSKTISTDGYTPMDFAATFHAYQRAGYGIEAVSHDRPQRLLSAGFRKGGRVVSASTEGPVLQMGDKWRTFESLAATSHEFKRMKREMLR